MNIAAQDRVTWRGEWGQRKVLQGKKIKFCNVENKIKRGWSLRRGKGPKFLVSLWVTNEKKGLS